MATERDIAGWFLALQKAAEAVVDGDSMPAAESAQMKMLAEVGLRIGESVVLDLNRIADALEVIVLNTRK